MVVSLFWDLNQKGFKYLINKLANRDPKQQPLLTIELHSDVNSDLVSEVSLNFLRKSIDQSLLRLSIAVHPLTVFILLWHLCPVTLLFKHS